jgi:DNA processing protein
LDPDLLYQLALGDVPYIGNVHAKILSEHFATARDIFRAGQQKLEKIEGIGEIRARSIASFRNFGKAEAEQEFISKHGISATFIKNADYPKRLLNCYDPPALLFYRGSISFNKSKMVAIVGTRGNSDYGKQITEKIVRELAKLEVIVVSGLAYGIDALAHRAALKNNIPTIGVTAHGLDTIYPPENASLAKNMIQCGAILTEFRSKTPPDKYNFPSRNRIVAGMCDATIIIESGLKGGSMITADMASGYNRDVFAVPGRLTDPGSAGCNYLISSNKAIPFRDVSEMALAMGWTEQHAVHAHNQKALFTDLSDTEKNIIALLQQKGPLGIDDLTMYSGISSGSMAAALLKLELNFITERLPGKIYRIRF